VNGNFKELKNGEIILFKGATGSASFTEIKNKGVYFTPTKKGLQLKGERKPVIQYEKFVYNGSEVLHAKGSSRTVKIFLTRIESGQQCYTTETHLWQYFVYCEAADSDQHRNINTYIM
jgi:hypothetical protein